MWNAPAAGSMQFINVSLGTHLSAPRGLSAFTIEPATWKHQQPDGTTRLVGTTWYSHGLRPEPYWRLWSDLMVHAIPRRVLDHIRREAER
jgi:hypothetical protein